MTVLIGYLPTPEGDAAVEAGLVEARRRGEPVVIINSPRRGPAVDRALAPDDIARDLLARAEAAGVEAELRHPLHDDDVAEVFATTATETGASLIVIGLRRRSAVGKFLLGSEAQRILLDSAVPVLSVKADA